MPQVSFEWASMVNGLDVYLMCCGSDHGLRCPTMAWDAEAR